MTDRAADSLVRAAEWLSSGAQVTKRVRVDCSNCGWVGYRSPTGNYHRRCPKCGGTVTR